MHACTPTQRQQQQCSRINHTTSATTYVKQTNKKGSPPLIQSINSHWSGGCGEDLLSGRVNSRLTHCQHNPRGSLLENPVLRCQVAPHNSLARLRPAISRARHAASSRSCPASCLTTGRGSSCKPGTWTQNVVGLRLPVAPQNPESGFHLSLLWSAFRPELKTDPQSHLCSVF